MSRKRHAPEQVMGMLREAEVRLSRGQSASEVCRGPGVSDQGCHRRRREHGGMEVSQARGLKELQREDARLRRAVSDLTLDRLILDEALTGRYRALHAAGAVLVMSWTDWLSVGAGPAVPLAGIARHGAGFLEAVLMRTLSPGPSLPWPASMAAMATDASTGCWNGRAGMWA